MSRGQCHVSSVSLSRGQCVTITWEVSRGQCHVGSVSLSRGQCVTITWALTRGQCVTVT